MARDFPNPRDRSIAPPDREGAAPAARILPRAGTDGHLFLSQWQLDQREAARRAKAKEELAKHLSHAGPAMPLRQG
jgi:hypothetical protein